MDDRIKQLLSQMTALEDELRTALSEQQSSIFFQIKGKRVEFEKSIKQTHHKLKKNFFRWLVTDRPQNLITGPIIYSMIIPLLVTGLFITFYQLTCFPIYGIKKYTVQITLFLIDKICNTLILLRNFTVLTAPTAAA